MIALIFVATFLIGYFVLGHALTAMLAKHQANKVRAAVGLEKVRVTPWR